ncbi:MAG: glycoside hydrolase family 5 protein [Alphaproteobacteria bacterium]|nr:glycoside hydrolase family 5 protein [Alphaproteobacteria bacterium]
MLSRRHLLAALPALAAAPNGWAQEQDKYRLWDNATGPHLRGAVLVQRRVYPQIDGPEFLGPGPVGTPITDDALDRLAASGANLAILSHPGIFSEVAPYRLDEAVLTHLSTLIARCAQRGLYVVIGFRTGPGRSEFTFHREDGDSWFPAHMINERVWSDYACHDAWARMWRETAQRFRAWPNVAGYLLMVEPNANQAGPQGEIWEAERLRAAVASTPADWPALARRLRDAIREVDGETPILVSPDGYANAQFEPLLGLRGDPSLVLALHDYAPREYTHQPIAADIAFTPADALIAPPTHPRWMVGEFGAVRWAPRLTRFLEQRINGLEAAGAGWSWFRWDGGWRIYEDQENRFNLDYGTAERPVYAPLSHPAGRLLARYWRRNLHHPEQILRR